MKKFITVLLIVINSSFLFAQTPLTIEGTTTVELTTGNWMGVNIPRSTPTTFIFRNNSITSQNISGYMLQAGDEGPNSNSNHLDGEIITGNKFIWNGTDMTSITHGVFTGYNINAVIKYNYLVNVPMGLIRKSNGMTNTSGGVAYNIVINPNVGFVAKGINNVNVYNNTFYSTRSTTESQRSLVDIYNNTDAGLNAPSTGTKIKNNIFYTKYQIYNIHIYEAACLAGFESDYNVFYCESGTPVFNYLGALKTFTQWQALGFDLHSVVVNPNFINFIDLVPTVRLNYGTDLGVAWQTGLSVNAVWGTTDPATAEQNSTWQVGARVYATQDILVNSIAVTGQGGATTISTDNGTLQLSATVLPANAADKSITWSIINGTGQATISPAGLVTAVDNGTVTARATANDISGVYGNLIITLSNQVVPVTGITVTGAGGATTISTDDGTLQLSATVLPSIATNKAVTWSIINFTGQASINATGLVTALDNGTVTARATATDGSAVFGALILNLSNQIVSVTGITITGEGGATSISTDNGILQLTAAILPANASIKSVTWSIVAGAGLASINATGVLTALDNGSVTARATANDGSGVIGTLIITISNQVVPVAGITVTGADGAINITTENGTLQLSAAVLPANATNKTITWSIVNGTGQATINATGLVTAVADGTVTARATANDGSGVVGTLIITNSKYVTGITVTGAGGATTISTDNGTLQLNAAILPVNATNNTVTWSIITGADLATISSGGLLTALDNGPVTVRTTATDGSGVFGTIIITISNQIVPVISITVTGAGGVTTITTDNGTLQLSASLLPTNATNKTVTWSIINGTGQAVISTGGLVTAIAIGTVTARATANDGSAVYGTLLVTITITVTGITVSGTGGATTITSDNGTLQLIAALMPVNAADKTVTWSLVNGTGQATINATGLVTAVDNGTVTARATANDGSGVYGTLIITNSNQIVPITGISVTGAGGATTITTDNGTLQLSAAIFPVNASNKTVIWSLVNGTGQATINTTGLVTAVDNGSVTARATANDGTAVFGTLIINLTNQVVPVTSITVSGAGGVTTITTDNGTLQLSSTLLPVNATNKTVIWSIVNGTGQAIINATGFVTAVDNGTVTARATANDGSGVFGTMIITISNQLARVTSITVTGSGGLTTITSDNGTLQLSPIVLPVNAADKTVTWSIVNGTGQATINATGLVTAVDNGTVTARATANDGSGVSGTLTITNSNQIVPVTGISVTGAGGATTITTDDGTLQLSAAIFPVNASNKTFTWSLVNGTGQATINTTGLVTAVDNGSVTARATANDGTSVFGTFIITLTNQVVSVTSISISVEGGVTTITTDDGTLQLSSTLLPVNATNKTVSWSIVNGSGQATINANGLVTAVDNGVVTARATANDGSGVFGTLIITISSQIIPVTGITVTGAGGSTTIIVNDGTLQLSASVFPVNATDKSVNWSIVNNTGQAIINSTGLVTAVENGTITAIATANESSVVFGFLIITISNQIIPVTDITVTGEGGSTTITTTRGTLQLNAAILPIKATNKYVTWLVINGTGQATISATGLLTADENGTVTARATAGSGVFGTLIITITNQPIHVTAISVTGAGGANSITFNKVTLQLSATVLPGDATVKTVTWSIKNRTGEATISDTGFVTAITNGIVTAIATANDGSGIYGTLEITISDIIRSVTGEYEPLKIIVTSYEMKIFLYENNFSWKADLYNLQGRLIMSKLVDSEIVAFDISSLASGIYIIVFSHGDKLMVSKVIKP